MNLAASPGTVRALKALFAAFVVFLYAPIAVVVVFSFNDDTLLALPLRGFTTRWYEQLAHNRDLIDAVLTSLRVTLATVAITMPLATLAALALVRARFPGRGLITGFLVLPLVMPVIALAISLFVLFRELGVEFSWQTIVAGHVVVSMPYALLVLLPRLQALDPALDEAARDLGAGALGTFTRVTLPLITPALLSSLVLVFTISFDEFVITLFTAGTESTFSLYLVSSLRFPARLPQLVAVTVVVMTVSITVVTLAEVGRRAVERRWERRSA